MIELSGIEVRLRPGAAPALHGLDLRVAEGEFVILAGANGSGKSTLIRLLAGLVEPAAGSMHMHQGVTVGLVAQDPAAQLVAGSVARDVAFGLEVAGRSDVLITTGVEDALEALTLEPLAWRAPQELSGGEQQRTALAGAIAADAGLLLLDEPGSHLDERGRWQLADSLSRLRAERGVTVVMATQHADDFPLADRVVVLREGRVALERTPRMLAAELAGAPQLAAELELEPPSAARLAYALAGLGAPLQPGTPLTLDELAAALGVQP